MLGLKPLKTVLKAWGETGMRLPHAYDASTGIPSSALMYSYVSFLIAICSLIYVHWKPELLPVTGCACVFFVVCRVLYMLRNLHSFKADLDDKSLELESADGAIPDSGAKEEKGD